MLKKFQTYLGSFFHLLSLAGVMLAATSLLQGCASVPRAAPELSVELGNRIRAFETSHMNLLRKYFDEKRDRVDKFVYNEWIPVFAEELFRDSTILATWTQVVKSDDPEDRVTFLVKIGPRIQQKINSKRQELIEPLDKVERTLERRLIDDYNQLKAMNNSLTSFLMSASEVEESRSRFLASFGITEEKVSSVFDSVDTVVEKLIQIKQGGEDAVSKGKQFQNDLDGILKSISGQNNP